jgi:hypothetical protein
MKDSYKVAIGLLILAVISIVLYFALRKTDHFSINPKQKQCSDAAIDKSIINYQINPLNQHKFV